MGPEDGQTETSTDEKDQNHPKLGATGMQRGKEPKVTSCEPALTSWSTPVPVGDPDKGCSMRTTASLHAR